MLIGGASSRSEHMTTRSWYDVKSACAAAGIHRSTLYRYWDLGVGPRYAVLPGGQRRIRCDWFDDWLLSREVVAA